MRKITMAVAVITFVTVTSTAFAGEKMMPSKNHEEHFSPSASTCVTSHDPQRMTRIHRHLKWFRQQKSQLSDQHVTKKHC